MNSEDMLRDFIEEQLTPIYMTDYGQVKDYYKDQFGARGWIGGMAQALSGSSSRSGKEYLAARRSIERFDSGQAKSMRKYGGERITAVGRQLPPIDKQLRGDLKFQLRGTQQGKKRIANIEIKGIVAQNFVLNPNWNDLWEEYGVDGQEFEDGEYEFEVTSISAA